MSTGEHAQLLFHYRYRERRVLGDVAGQLISKHLKLPGGHQVIDDGEALGALRRYRLRSTPDSTLDHSNHGSRQFLDSPHEIAQRIVPAQWISAPFRKLGDIVTRRPHLCTGLRAQHNDTCAFPREASQRIDNCVDELLRERIALFGMVECYRANRTIDFLSLDIALAHSWFRSSRASPPRGPMQIGFKTTARRSVEYYPIRYHRAPNVYYPR